MDWVAWHADYDSDTPLRRRLEVVQRRTREFLEEWPGSPVRVISMCAGEARDLLGALDSMERRDVTGRLVELDPTLAARAQEHATRLGLAELEVVAGDAGQSAAYEGVAPADLLLACGVFGNISDADIERTVRAFPELVRKGGSVIWTRGRAIADVTPLIRGWLKEIGFEELAFDLVPDAPGTVGVARNATDSHPLVDQQLFTFTRTDSGRDGR